jgi:hypothetical protein
MKISVVKDCNKVKITIIRSEAEFSFLSSVAGVEALIEKLENVMSEIDGKDRGKKSMDFGELFGDLWKTKRR